MTNTRIQRRVSAAQVVQAKSGQSESIGSHCLSYYPHISQTSLPKQSKFLQQLKHFSHSPLSSPSLWQEARPYWSGCLSVPGPKLTQPIGGGNHDLTNKRNKGLQRGGRGSRSSENHTGCAIVSQPPIIFGSCGAFSFLNPKSRPALAEPS